MRLWVRIGRPCILKTAGAETSSPLLIALTLREMWADMKAKTKKSTVNAAGNYTKPTLRKKIVSQVKAAATQGTGAGEWSARKAQLVAKKYKAAGGGYRD